MPPEVKAIGSGDATSGQRCEPADPGRSRRLERESQSPARRVRVRLHLLHLLHLHVYLTVGLGRARNQRERNCQGGGFQHANIRQ